MPTTSNYGYPYPSPTVSPNVPADMQALATALDTETARIDGDLADCLTNDDYFAGSVTVNAIADTPTSQAISFGKTFSVTPICTATAVSVAPGTVVEVTVNNQTTTGCTVTVYRTTTSAVTVNVIAFVPS